MFKRDIKFSIETRKFIKSMQFRLETYKQECMKKNNTESNNKKLFFTKILSNTNVGIEFFKPHKYNIFI